MQDESVVEPVKVAAGSKKKSSVALEQKGNGAKKAAAEAVHSKVKQAVKVKKVGKTTAAVPGESKNKAEAKAKKAEKSGKSSKVKKKVAARKATKASEAKAAPTKASPKKTVVKAGKSGKAVSKKKK